MFAPDTFVDPSLTAPDAIVLGNLRRVADGGANDSASNILDSSDLSPLKLVAYNDADALAALQAFNDPTSASYEPTIFLLWDKKDIPDFLSRLLRPFTRWAQGVARNPLDVVMVVHLLLYLTTSLPSAAFLFYHFTWVHGVFHAVMQGYYVGTYTLMRHQHIHMNGILAKRSPYTFIDSLYPYVIDPLMGHTWNTYYYHHVKHHHVEANGPDDLSSTIRYQRDELLDLLHYVFRFFFVIWVDLPRYFVRKGQTGLALRAAFWEVSCLSCIALLTRWKPRPAMFVLLIPLLCLRLGLMVGNWGQHAFVDEVEPDSDYRSSITLIDVASNRFCFNDGYHTSHHLNPRRHWREHPTSLIKQKERYSKERALVFCNIDYIMITVRLMMKDYEYLARCMVPIGDQIHMTMAEREAMLRTKTRRFTEADIKRLFYGPKLHSA